MLKHGTTYVEWTTRCAKKKKKKKEKERKKKKGNPDKGKQEKLERIALYFFN